MLFIAVNDGRAFAFGDLCCALVVSNAIFRPIPVTGGDEGFSQNKVLEIIRIAGQQPPPPHFGMGADPDQNHSCPLSSHRS